MNRKFHLLTTLLLCMTYFTQAQLPTQGIDIAPLLIGESMPNSPLKTLEGDLVTLKELASVKPTLVIVYRGGWCPYCTRHLSAIGEQEAEINALGYQIVAISPDSPESLKSTLGEYKLSYQLLSDATGAFIREAGLAWQAPEKYGEMLSKSSGGANDQRILPVPAVFVLDQEGKIAFEYINPDYSKRLTVNMLMANLTALISK